MSHFNKQWIKDIIGNKNDLIIFDIGAYNFDDSISFKKDFPNSEVYAFEAFDFNFKNYGSRAINNGVKIYNIAVSDNNTDAIFYNSTDLNGRQWTCSGSLLMPSAKEGVEIHKGLNYNKIGIPVKTTRIDDFCKLNNISHIDVIHMDIQGAEYYAIKGLGEFKPKILFCETCEFESYENALTLEDLDKLLFSLGYSIQERLIYDTLYILNEN